MAFLTSAGGGLKLQKSENHRQKDYNNNKNNSMHKEMKVQKNRESFKVKYNKKVKKKT